MNGEYNDDLLFGFSLFFFRSLIGKSNYYKHVSKINSDFREPG